MDNGQSQMQIQVIQLLVLVENKASYICCRDVHNISPVNMDNAVLRFV